MSTPIPNLQRAATMPERAASGQCATSNAASDIPSASPARSSSSSKQAYTTQVVKAMFGGNVGEVVQDFSCSFERKAGRLYVSTIGLFYYSNLFGFEKRIRVNYDDALGIKTVRTTSLSVQLKGGGEYIFRSFENREHVLDIISRFHSNTSAAAVNDETMTASNAPAREEEKEEKESRDKSFDEVDNEAPARQERSPVPDLAEEVQRGAVQSIEREVKDRPASRENDVEEWEKKKQHAKEWEPLVTNLNIACKSTDAFFDLFLKDGATHSLDGFSKAIGDQNIVISAWSTDNGAETANGEMALVRTVQLERNAGVSTAKVERRQMYQRFGIHACLRNETSITGIKGVPNGAFVVEDVWLLEGANEKGITLNVRVTVRFLKSINRVLKRIIMNRTLSETKDWYSRYSSFVRLKMHQAPVQEEIVPSAAAKEGIDWLGMVQQYVANLSEFCQNVPVPLIVVVFAVFIYRLKLRVIALEELVEEFEQRLLKLEADRQAINIVN